LTDLAAAVRSAAAAGIVSDEQGDRLIGHFAGLGLIASSVAPSPGFFGDLVASRDEEPAPPVEESEAPRFVRGFHDILITIGVIAALAGVWMLSNSWVMLAATILLSEILIIRQRLALPAFTLTLFYVVAIFASVGPLIGAFDVVEGGAIFGLVLFIAQPVALAPFYWRYRVPVALAAMILSAFWIVFFLVMSILEASLPGAGNVFETHPVTTRLVALVCALALFATAMGFDLRDPARVTRRSDVAFWLHLCAAPALLYSLVLLFSRPQDGVIWWTSDPGMREALIAVAIVAVLMLVGIVIDRRAFVTSGLISLGAAILILARVADLGLSNVAAVAVLLVGLIVLVLGIGWQRLRRVLLAGLPGDLRKRLPPVAA